MFELDYLDVIQMYNNVDFDTVVDAQCKRGSLIHTFKVSNFVKNLKKMDLFKLK